MELAGRFSFFSNCQDLSAMTPFLSLNIHYWPLKQQFDKKYLTQIVQCIELALFKEYFPIDFTQDYIKTTQQDIDYFSQNICLQVLNI